MVTTEGVSCITTQTNSKGVFLCFNVKKQMRDYEGEQPAHDTRVYTRANREYMHARLAKHKSNPRIYACATCKTQELRVMRELHIRRVAHTQKTHF